MHRAAALLIALVLAGCASNPPGSLVTTSATPGPAPTPAGPRRHRARRSLRRPPRQANPYLAGAQFIVASPGRGLPATFDPKAVHIDLEPFASGLNMPVFVTGTGDGSGRLFAVEQPGTIRIVSTDGTVVAKPFLDITSRLLSGGERGLLGLALHAGFATNGRFFVDYTRAPRWSHGHQRVPRDRRHCRSGIRADPPDDPQPYANHNGGMVAFDPAGMLMIGMGDGGSGGDPQGNGQNRDALLGKLLRIDVDSAKPYGLPKDNPFLDAADTQPAIWDLGMRNPWRFSFDRQTGDLFIGDVGQDSWEEIDAERAGTGGLNYGWNLMEARHCFQAGCDQAGLTLPVAEYSHQDGCSVTGGYVYRGEALPDLVGGYLFSDYCCGQGSGRSPPPTR